ncbi:calcitonin gene-related peptide type 1 receptor-like [Diaphorina citri]|uniref:Calcitonin gene-related peptide type 1 receptor-like n=1 Tax=Diaphorina citri TaxID=121845 RepID=A0A3Q0IY21_DIACI|nr:calcitonin gene-related peptide type 1 receptor-like [Diaphorina citri]
MSDESDFVITPSSTNLTSNVKLLEKTSEILFLLRLYEKCEAQKKDFDHVMFNDSTLYCPTMFDGWSCWNATLAGETARTPCPNFIVGFDSRRFALRTCLENGTWFQHPVTRKFWSNYTTCIDIEDLKFRKAMNIIYISGYSISLATLLISLVIFLIFKKAMNIIYISGYSISLATLLISLVIFLIFNCWMNDAHSRWILTVPVCLSILVNLAILMNVLRVLLTKLHSNSTNPAPIGIRKAARAALILVPLFGLHHILLPFRPEPKSPWEMVYDVFSAVLVSSQGLCVSILFCFANVDVHGAFRKMFYRLQRRGTHSTMVLHTNYCHSTREFQL